MSRGNQREQDRLKAQKKSAASGKGKPKQSATSLAQRREADAEAVRLKMAAKAALKAEGGDDGVAKAKKVK